MKKQNIIGLHDAEKDHFKGKIISDIFLRMLKPEELKVMQEFPKDYIIDYDYNGNKYPVSK